MRTTPQRPAPDDDPRFQQWINDVGPMQEPPPFDDQIDVGKPLAAAVAVLVAAAGIVVALGWAAMGFAIDLDVFDVGALVLLAVGTVLVITGGAFAYVAHLHRNRAQQ